MPAVEIALWSVPLTADAGVVAAFEGFLSGEERARARQFLFEHLATRYILGRGALRVLLAEALGTTAAAIPLEAGRAGKPQIRGDDLQFNLSHTGSLAVCAIGGRDAIGIDVEHVRAMPNLDSIARSYFSPAECAQLEALDPALRTAAFYRCWTRKEAYLKAHGDGLLAPLHDFDVSLLPTAEPRVHRISGSEEAAAEWTLLHLDPAPGCVGALAVHACTAIVRPWQHVRDAQDLLTSTRN